jgi:hypothetical protein
MGKLYDGMDMMLRQMVISTVMRLHAEVVEEMFLSSIQ